MSKFTHNEMIDTKDIATKISDNLGGKYLDAWNNGSLIHSRYIGLAKNYDDDTAIEELMDDVDSMFDD